MCQLDSRDGVGEDIVQIALTFSVQASHSSSELNKHDKYTLLFGVLVTNLMLIQKFDHFKYKTPGVDFIPLLQSFLDVINVNNILLKKIAFLFIISFEVLTFDKGFDSSRCFDCQGRLTACNANEGYDKYVPCYAYNVFTLSNLYFCEFSFVGKV